MARIFQRLTPQVAANPVKLVIEWQKVVERLEEEIARIGATTADLTFNNSGAGGASGTVFNGGVAKTVSYNTVGAAASGHDHTGVYQPVGSYLTANQTITFSGDATGSGSTSVTLTIPAGTVTYAKMQDVSAASKLLGRGDSGSGDVQEITLGSGLTMTGTTLSASGGGGGGTTTNALTFNNAGSGAASGSTFDGSSAVTISYNTVGAAASSHTHTLYQAGPITPPTTTSLGTWVNQGTSTATDGTGALILKPQVNENIRGLETTAPTAPYDIYCRFDCDMLSTSAITSLIKWQAGILLRDSSDGEIIVCGVQSERAATDEQNTYALIIARWTNATTNNAYPVVKYNMRNWQWLRVNVTSTTITFYASQDGKNWIQVGTETISTFVDTVDRIGVFAAGNAAATEVVANFSYFSTTAPA